MAWKTSGNFANLTGNQGGKQGISEVESIGHLVTVC